MAHKTKTKITLSKYSLYVPLLAAMLIFFSSALKKEDYPKEDPIVQMEAVQTLPQFPGGKAGWQKFLESYQYPQEARQHDAAGRIFIGFIVEKDGSLTDFKIIRDIGFGTGEEAIRLLKTSPKWTPGIQNGLKVRVAYTQPIALSIN